ncbi:competence type IV pilus major pilin ComGC [Alkalihalobacillus trypoxylicola]|uniref:ComG operon protein 3 n=1 Tax=Alkalihalobacillus trypoxylicola TaxID=519424 RepID=A0A161PEK4_9BACI|nr:competence type IV pilus major pilin ComGC [Alkalihalobacillus trypoxylicola]KYG30989.1 hypothetical protein AZF04_18505 [Alkalihalobacillus trypoxylicola]
MKPIKGEEGFTLIEMLVVLLVISALLLILVPNMTKNTDSAHAKSCEATVKIVQSQVYAYQIDFNELPESIDSLSEYLNLPEGSTDLQCSNGSPLQLDSNGIVRVNP